MDMRYGIERSARPAGYVIPPPAPPPPSADRALVQTGCMGCSMQVAGCNSLIVYTKIILSPKTVVSSDIKPYHTAQGKYARTRNKLKIPGLFLSEIRLVFRAYMYCTAIYEHPGVPA